MMCIVCGSDRLLYIYSLNFKRKHWTRTKKLLMLKSLETSPSVFRMILVPQRRRKSVFVAPIQMMRKMLVRRQMPSYSNGQPTYARCLFNFQLIFQVFLWKLMVLFFSILASPVRSQHACNEQGFLRNLVRPLPALV